MFDLIVIVDDDDGRSITRTKKNLGRLRDFLSNP